VEGKKFITTQLILMNNSLNYEVDEHPDLLEGERGSSFPVRIMAEADLPRITEIDAKARGHREQAYLEEQFAYCVGDPGMNTSLVAEADGLVVGFLLGRIFLGEFGIPSTRAVLHTIGVHPEFTGHGVAHALLSQYRKNMEALRTEAIHTLVEWDRFELLAFFKSAGFRPSREVDLVWDTQRFPFSGKASGVEVGEAREEDLEGVSAIDTEYMQASRRRFHEGRLAASVERPRKNHFLIGRVEGRVAGFLSARIFQGEFGIDTARGVIESFAVGDAYRHQGVASTLLEKLLAWLAENEVHQIETLCRWNDWDLLQFFAYAGFRPSFRLNLELPFKQ
jgi:ribosomal protein S18 acetylase RimI-like enzyme